jgi:hypothetical protein
MKSPLPSVALALLLASSLATVQATPHFEACHERTGNNATLIVPASAVDLNGGSLEAGDELAVFTPDGMCAGWAVWKGSNAALAVWEDNPLTPDVDGFMPDQPLRYAVWDASEGVEYGQSTPVRVNYHTDFDDEGVFYPDAVYLVSSLTASAPVANEAEAPAAFALTGNFPNPFAERTTISYEIPSSARVKLEVYDMLGHRVDVLVDETRPAGKHETHFHAGSDLASGVYVYRLEVGNRASHRKMVLVN